MTRALAARRPMLPILHRVASDAPALTILAILLILSLIPLYAAMALDARIFQDESPWMKPVKFHYALVVYTSTLAFFARYMPEATRTGRAWRWFTAAVVFAIMAEVAWLWAAAMVNTASHFNTEVPIFAAIYPVMGVLAVILTSAGLVMGVGIWRNRATGLAAPVHLSVALGLGLTFLLTVPVAGYLSGAGGMRSGRRHVTCGSWAGRGMRATCGWRTSCPPMRCIRCHWRGWRWRRPAPARQSPGSGWPPPPYVALVRAPLRRPCGAALPAVSGLTRG
jgi:hypothetical protein